jgi:hypothetical protein
MSITINHQTNDISATSGSVTIGGAAIAAVSLAEQEFTATSGQTVFTVTGGITNADNVSVYLNGAKLFSTDVTISAASNTVTLATGATTGDLITVTEVAGAASGGGGSGSGVTTYADKTTIDAVSSPSEGDLAYDLAADQLYIRTTSAWKRVSIGVDESPVITTEPPTSHDLNNDGSTSTVTMVAYDPEGFGITYGIAYPTTNNALPNQLVSATSINQSTGVYTFDPSTDTADVGNVKVRLSASDGISTTTRFVTLNLSLVQGWMLGSASYDSVSYSVSSQEVNPTALDLSPDGTVMIVTGETSDSFQFYTLSTAFDVSTASHAGSVSTGHSRANGARFGDSGNQVYAVDRIQGTVRSIPLSTAYDYSSAGTATASTLLGTLSSNANTASLGLAFKTDGTKMYTIQNGTVYEYGLSTAWDISTLSYTTSFSTISQDGNSQEIDFSSDGTKMFYLGGTSNIIYQYDLSTAWDVSTASYSNTSFSVNSQDIYARGICFGDSGKTMYMVGVNSDTVYQYSTEA